MADLLAHIRIVLVEPTHPGNIGGTARAMKTMGLENLYLVRPERYPDPQAHWRAANAKDVLDNAIVVDTLEEAIGDCARVVGTSTRERSIPWPRLNAHDLGIDLAGMATRQPVAILFGREASGLTNEELQACQVHLQIPANPEYSSLNLAMAVQVVCYELYQAFADTELVTGWDKELATSAQLEQFFVHLESTLRELEFYDDRAPRQALTRLRRLFGRIALDETEVGMLRGVLTHIQRALNSGPK